MQQLHDALDDIQLFFRDLEPFVERRDQLCSDILAWHVEEIV